MDNDNELNNLKQAEQVRKALEVIVEHLECQDNKIHLLKEYVIAFGYNTAAFLSYLLNKHTYYSRHNQLAEHKTQGPGWFYFTIEACTDQLYLSRDEQDYCIKKLKSAGIIEVVTMGMPPKRYFRLNVVKIAKILVDNSISANMRKNHKLNCGNSSIRTEEKPQLCHIDNIYNNKLKREDIAPPSGSAKKPSSSSPEKKIKKAKHVEVTQDEHQKLVEKFGPELTKQGYEELSEWKQSADPKQVKKHASDYYRLRKWVIPDLVANSSKNSNVAKHRQGSKLVTPGDAEPDTFRRKRL